MKWFIRIFIGGGLIIFGGGSLMMLLLEFGLPWQYAEKQRVIASYLEEKYHDDFTFDGMRFDFLHGRNYYTYATAESTGESFYVEVSPEGIVDDAYAYEYWNVVIRELFEPIVQPVLTYSALHGDVFLTRKMDVNTFDASAASFALHVEMGVFLAEQPPAQVAQWYAALEAIRAAELSLEQLTIVYYDAQIMLTEEQLQSIQSAEQLRDYFERTAQISSSMQDKRFVLFV